MPRWRSIWLVARREILERGRSRGFILSVLFTTLIVVGSFVVPALLFGDEDATKVGLVEPAPAALPDAITSAAARFDQKVEITTFPDAAAADAALEDGSVDVVVAMPADLSGAGRSASTRSPTSRSRRASRRRSSACASRRRSTRATSTRRRWLPRSSRRRSVQSSRRPRPTRRASCSPTSARC